MRRTLDILYQASGIAAAISLTAMMLVILLGISSNIFNFYIKGHDAYARYLLASTFFLGLVYTLRSGGHIRVSLVLDQLSTKLKSVIDGVCFTGAAVLSCYVAYAMGYMTLQTYQIGEVSQATDATPLWIVQLPATCGAILLAVAFIDATISHWFFNRTIIPTGGSE